jgi:4-hydroxy-tetrahydrodipicolinate synthase
VSALRAALPPEFTILSGDDSLTLPFMAAGAEGVISVASNVIPGDVVAMVNAALSGNFAKARAMHHRLYPLFKDLFIEPNPVPTKYALALRGEMRADVRLPLCEMGEATAAKFQATLRQLQLIP